MQINKKNRYEDECMSTQTRTLYTLTSVSIFSSLFSIFHLEADKENLFNNQENVELVIIFFILMILMNDSAVLL